MKNIILIIVSVLALAACAESASQNVSEPEVDAPDVIQLTQEQIETIDLSLTQLEEKQVDATVKLNGKVVAAPSDMVSITSALGGYVKNVYILPGSNFKKGQLLATLEDNQFIQLQQDYLATQVNLKMAKLNFERQKELNQTKAASDKTLQQAEAEYRTLEVTLRALEEKLRLIHVDPKTVTAENIKSNIPIYAPFSGTVTEMFVNVGRYVSPSETLFNLVNPQGFLLSIKAFEKDLKMLKSGQVLHYSTNESPEQIAEARMVSIGQTVSEDGSTDILARPNHPSKALVLGMYVNAEIAISNKKALVLPKESVVMYENKWYVFEQQTPVSFKMHEVKVGIEQEGTVEILDPVHDKNIVANGAYALLMALKNKGEE
jgi:cobalt-zinc-cadmium efflux system membrane fusion protein